MSAEVYAGQQNEGSPATPHLYRAAATFLCAVAFAGAIEGRAVADTGRAGVPPPIVSEHTGIGGSEIVIPSPLLPSVNVECGDPDIAAPKQEQVDSMLCRFNNVRTVPLVEDPELDMAAEEKLEDIIDDRHFSHRPLSQTTDPLEHIKEVKGTDGTWMMGEDLTYGEGMLGKARSRYAAWKQSATHWANITNERFTNVGFAVKHVKQIVMNVDFENGFEIRQRLQHVTFWVAEFWGR
jgi:hypothetical protein